MDRATERKAPLTELLALGGLALAYYAAARLGLAFAFAHIAVSPFWPPTGLALAALLLGGPRLWPGVTLGAFLANYLLTGSLGIGLGLAVGNTLEAVTGAWLVRRFTAHPTELCRTRDVLGFVGLAAGVGTIVSASIGNLVLVLADGVTLARFGGLWLTWWLGDMMGAIVWAPFVLAWARRPARAPSAREAMETAAVSAGLALVAALVFCGWPTGALERYPLEYLAVPFLVWAAFRLPLRGVSLALVVLSLIASYGTARGGGPFSAGDPNESLLLLQAFLGINSVLTLVLRAVIAERAALEEELRRSNRELERFARVASHDLREPLRNIALHLELLERRAGARLTGEEPEILRFARDAARRLTALVEALLAHSRLDGERRARNEVRLDALIAQVLADLRVAIDESGAAISADALPTVRVDEQQYKQLFQNLIANAIRYRGEATPRIRIAARRDGAQWEFSVVDNGIGIEPQHAQRIFKMFERVERGSGEPGYGIGLAICERVVEGHGGRIWVESAPGQGARFVFTLPQ